MRTGDHRHFMLQIALKCADICNPCRPWEVSRAWSLQVSEEFYRQGDLERRLGLSVTPLCDRYTSSVSKIQTGFFRFIAAPLFEEWHRFHATPLSWNMLNYLRSNKVVVSSSTFLCPLLNDGHSLVLIAVEMGFYSERRRVGWRKLGRVPTPRSGVVRAWRFGNGHGKDSLAKGFSFCEAFWPMNVEFYQFFSGRVGRGTRDRRARRRQRRDKNRCGISDWRISSAHSISLTRRLLPRRLQPDRRSCHWQQTAGFAWLSNCFWSSGTPTSSAGESSF